MRTHANTLHICIWKSAEGTVLCILKSRRNRNVGGKLHSAAGNRSNKVQRGDGLRRCVLEIYNELSALSETSTQERITNKPLRGFQQICLWKSLESFKMHCLSAWWIMTQDRWISIWECEGFTNTELWSRLPRPLFSYEDWSSFWAEELYAQLMWGHMLFQHANGVILMHLLFSQCYCRQNLR